MRPMKNKHNDDDDEAESQQQTPRRPRRQPKQQQQEEEEEIQSTEREQRRILRSIQKESGQRHRHLQPAQEQGRRRQQQEGEDGQGGGERQGSGVEEFGYLQFSPRTIREQQHILSLIYAQQQGRPQRGEVQVGGTGEGEEVEDLQASASTEREQRRLARLLRREKQLQTEGEGEQSGGGEVEDAQRSTSPRKKRRIRLSDQIHGRQQPHPYRQDESSMPSSHSRRGGTDRDDENDQHNSFDYNFNDDESDGGRLLNLRNNAARSKQKRPPSRCCPRTDINQQRTTKRDGGEGVNRKRDRSNRSGRDGGRAGANNYTGCEVFENLGRPGKGGGVISVEVPPKGGGATDVVDLANDDDDDDDRGDHHDTSKARGDGDRKIPAKAAKKKTKTTSSQPTKQCYYDEVERNLVPRARSSSTNRSRSSSSSHAGTPPGLCNADGIKSGFSFLAFQSQQHQQRQYSRQAADNFPPPGLVVGDDGGRGRGQSLSQQPNRPAPGDARREKPSLLAGAEQLNGRPQGSQQQPQKQHQQQRPHKSCSVRSNAFGKKGGGCVIYTGRRKQSTVNTYSRGIQRPCLTKLALKNNFRNDSRGRQSDGRQRMQQEALDKDGDQDDDFQDEYRDREQPSDACGQQRQQRRSENQDRFMQRLETLQPPRPSPTNLQHKKVDNYTIPRRKRSLSDGSENDSYSNDSDDRMGHKHSKSSKKGRYKDDEVYDGRISHDQSKTVGMNKNNDHIETVDLMDSDEEQQPGDGRGCGQGRRGPNTDDLTTNVSSGRHRRKKDKESSPSTVDSHSMVSSPGAQCPGTSTYTDQNAIAPVADAVKTATANATNGKQSSSRYRVDVQDSDDDKSESAGVANSRQSKDKKSSHAELDSQRPTQHESVPSKASAQYRFELTKKAPIVPSSQRPIQRIHTRYDDDGNVSESIIEDSFDGRQVDGIKCTSQMSDRDAERIRPGKRDLEAMSHADDDVSFDDDDDVRSGKEGDFSEVRILPGYQRSGVAKGKKNQPRPDTPAYKQEYDVEAIIQQAADVVYIPGQSVDEGVPISDRRPGQMRPEQNNESATASSSLNRISRLLTTAASAATSAATSAFGALVERARSPIAQKAQASPSATTAMGSTSIASHDNKRKASSAINAPAGARGSGTKKRSKSKSGMPIQPGRAITSTASPARAGAKSPPNISAAEGIWPSNSSGSGEKTNPRNHRDSSQEFAFLGGFRQSGDSGANERDDARYDRKTRSQKSSASFALMETSSIGTKGAKTRQSKKAKKTPEMIDLIDDSDGDSVEQKPESFDATNIPAEFVAVGKKVTVRDSSGISFSSKGKQLKLDLFFPPPPQRSTRSSSNRLRDQGHSKIVNAVIRPADVLELKYYIGKKDLDSSLETTDNDILPHFLSLLLEKKKAEGLGLNKSYDPSADPSSKKKYLVIELKPITMQNVLSYMKTLKHWTDFMHERNELDSIDAYPHAKPLLNVKAELYARMETADIDETFIIGKDDDDVLVVYPFVAEKEKLDKAAEGLNELVCIPSRRIEDMATSVSDTTNASTSGSDDLTQHKRAVKEKAEEKANAKDDGGGGRRKGRAHYVTIRVGDYKRLDPGIYLNDSLIDFFMQWISRDADKSEIHVFSTHFYTALSEESIATVTSWTANKNINVFQKKMIVIPINKHLHWSLAIVVNPGKIKEYAEFVKSNHSSNAGGNDYSDMEIPVLFFFDPMKNYHNKQEVVTNIHGWLKSEWRRLNSIEGATPISKQTLPGYFPKVPYQDNGWDCGVFLCRFAKAMYMLRTSKFTLRDQLDSKEGFSSLITNSNEFKFSMVDIGRMRNELKTLIKNLSDLYSTCKKEEKLLQKKGEEIKGMKAASSPSAPESQAALPDMREDKENEASESTTMVQNNVYAVGLQDVPKLSNKVAATLDILSEASDEKTQQELDLPKHPNYSEGEVTSNEQCKNIEEEMVGSFHSMLKIAEDRSGSVELTDSSATDFQKMGPSTTSGIDSTSLVMDDHADSDTQKEIGSVSGCCDV